MIAMIAQTLSAPDHRDRELWAIIAVILRTGRTVFYPYLYGAWFDPEKRAPNAKKAAFS